MKLFLFLLMVSLTMVVLVGGALVDVFDNYLESEFVKEKIGNSDIYTQIETESEHTEELETLDKSIQINTSDADNLRKKVLNGWDLTRHGGDEKLLSSYEKAIQTDPENPKAWNNMANALKRLGRYNYALDAINMSIQLDPEYAHAWSNKGDILQSLGKIEEAEEAFATARELET